MKSSKYTRQEDYQLVMLQKENLSLRNQLKQIGNKLNEAIEWKETQKKERITVKPSKTDELKEANKLIEIYKIEKAFLEKRVKKAENLGYFSKLTVQVENFQKVLNESQITKKSAELNEKKVTNYQNSPGKVPSAVGELEMLKLQKQMFEEKIQKCGDLHEKQKVLLLETAKNLSDLEAKKKQLTGEIGESYFKHLSSKAMVEALSKKEKVCQIMQKDTQSKLALLQQKIKTLENQLNLQKEQELQMNSSLLTAIKKIENYQENIRYSPMLKHNKTNPEHRSFSVKPAFSRVFFTQNKYDRY